jgi:hypothetical protein
MDLEITTDEVPLLFKMVIEELWSQESTTNSVATDAFGMTENIHNETSVPLRHQCLTKEMVIAESDNLDYYEKVQ